MAKRKAKRNVGISKLHGCFKICREPVVHFGAAVQSSDAADSASMPRICEEHMIFAIARDEGTIFARWDIDWPPVFNKAPPVRRQVHRRLVTGGGLGMVRVAVEPTRGWLHVTMS